MPGFQSTRLATEGALEPFLFLYTDDSIQGNPETCKQSSIMLNYEVKNTLTVYENVALMKDIKDDILNPITILERVGLKNHVKKFPNQLSGGEQQRVSIARAITKNPEILLCDEPTGALDSETGCKVLQLIQDVCREFQKTVIIVTHNSNIAKVADKVIRLKNGKILEISLNDSPADIKEVEW